MNQSTVFVEQSALAHLVSPPLHSLMTTILIFVHLGSLISNDLSPSRWKGDPSYRLWGSLSGSFDRSASGLASSNPLYSLLVAQ